jgi:DNA-binding transcriptional regulator YiaG
MKPKKKPRDYKKLKAQLLHRWKDAIKDAQRGDLRAYMELRGVRELAPNKWRELRFQAGMTQAEWSEAIPASLPACNRWENGRAVPDRRNQAQMRELAARGEK